MEEYELIAKTFQGLEEVLAQELTELGANNIQIGRRMVSFTGDKEMMYRANFCLRTAVRILKPIKQFQATDADDVYAAVRAIDWGQYLDLDTTFAVDTVVYSQEFRHSKFVAYKVKDAIVDYFRETTGQRPNIRITNPDIKLNMHVAEDRCTLSLDASGESLHLRGYRVASVEAPINEVLAAGLIKLTGWKADTDFIDPFCGSGTILIEAALMARNIYPGIFRKAFGFEKWKDFDRDLLDRIYNDDSAEREFDHKIIGHDINIHAIEATQANAKSAGVADIVSASQQDFKNFTKPAAPAIIVTNPPYGERITSPDLLGLYHTIGDRLKHEFTGGEAWIISYREECFEAIGLKPSIKIPLFNGSLDCEFRKYQIFDGKLGAFRAAGGVVKTDEERRRMGEKRRFKMNRGDFNGRYADRHDDTGVEDDDDFDAAGYAALRDKHREFERTYGRKHRDTDADRPFHKPADRKGGKDFRKGGEGFRKSDDFRRGNDSKGFRKSDDFRRGDGGRDFRRGGDFRKGDGKDFRRGGGKGFRKDGDSRPNQRFDD